jgi:hypothetical protein
MSSTTHFESVSKITCVIPLSSISFIACNHAIDSPCAIEYHPSFQWVPANTNIPIWLRKHHPTLVLFASLWNSASTFHLYQPIRMFCQSCCRCCWLTRVPPSCCRVLHYRCRDLIPMFRPVSLTCIVPNYFISIVPQNLPAVSLSSCWQIEKIISCVEWNCCSRDIITWSKVPNH